MRILWFVLSLIEWSALLCLIFAMFRFRIRDYIPFIIFTALLMSMFAYIMREILNLTLIAPSVQLLLLILVFKFMLHLSSVYAGIIVSFGYIVFTSLTTSIVLVLDWMSIFTLDEEYLSNFKMLHLLQLITVAIAFFAIILLVRYHIGFTFVPRASFRGNLPFIVLIILSAVALGLLLLKMNTLYIQAIFIGMTIILILSLHYLLKKEKQSVYSTK
jgi:hypothetical protein